MKYFSAPLKLTCEYGANLIPVMIHVINLMVNVITVADVMKADQLTKLGDILVSSAFQCSLILYTRK